MYEILRNNSWVENFFDLTETTEQKDGKNYITRNFLIFSLHKLQLGWADQIKHDWPHLQKRDVFTDVLVI